MVNFVPSFLSEDFWQWSARRAAEEARLKSLNPANPRLNDQAVPHVLAALDAGRGVVMPLPHSGNWDMAGVWMVQHFGTFTTVAERLKPESLYKRFMDYRESLGFEMGFSVEREG